MTAARGVAVAAVFVWLGMVVAISFIEAPLKFRAPGVTLPIGLGIGRLVFRALNGAELALGEGDRDQRQGDRCPGALQHPGAEAGMVTACMDCWRPSG